MGLNTVFEGNDGKWFGGVDAIYDDAAKNQERNNVVIKRFDKGGHFAMGGISREQVIRLGQSWGQPRWVSVLFSSSDDYYFSDFIFSFSLSSFADGLLGHRLCGDQ